MDLAEQREKNLKSSSTGDSVAVNSVAVNSVAVNSTVPLTDEVIAQVAQRVKKNNLHSPLIFLLEAHRPLRGVFYHGAIFCQPLFSPFLGAENINTLLRIMEDEEAVSKLIAALE